MKEKLISKDVARRAMEVQNKKIISASWKRAIIAIISTVIANAIIIFFVFISSWGGIKSDIKNLVKETEDNRSYIDHNMLVGSNLIEANAQVMECLVGIREKQELIQESNKEIHDNLKKEIERLEKRLDYWMDRLQKLTSDMNEINRKNANMRSSEYYNPFTTMIDSVYIKKQERFAKNFRLFSLNNRKL